VADESLVECSFFIPIRRDPILSDGEPHPPDVWRWLDELLFDLFGGRTLAPGFYRGFYRDPDTGQQVDDESRRYIVALPESEVARLRVLLASCCEWFQQKCIGLTQLAGLG
jgi:hypothetical protein